ncbi:MAG TPA: efflux RND transporter periplasmic adaptor subunit [Candidatus Binatia bacterium]|nr:efflux RND transporter periplasmic adaptor subunit [Candidatus Binatia bacterium]
MTVRRLCLVAIACAAAACDAGSGARTSDLPVVGPSLGRLADGTEALVLASADVPGAVVFPVRSVELPRTLETTGEVTFDDRRVATIISRVTGRVEDVRTSQWDTVKLGDPIISLYSPDYMTAEAEYLQAQVTSSISGSPALAGESGLADALVSAARRKLELLGLEPSDIASLKTPSATQVVRAPISGTVVEKQVVRGSQVNPGDVLFTLGTIDDVWITGDIYEDDVSRVRVGQPLEAVPLAFPDQVFRGTVERVSPNVDPNTHALQIRCQVRNPRLTLKPQMLVRVRIVTDAGAALIVPQDALVFETDGYYAFVQHDASHVTRRRVSIASWNEAGFARVASGLRAGESIVRGEALQINALWHQAHGESS